MLKDWSPLDERTEGAANIAVFSAHLKLYRHEFIWLPTYHSP